MLAHALERHESCMFRRPESMRKCFEFRAYRLGAVALAALAIAAPCGAAESPGGPESANGSGADVPAAPVASSPAQVPVQALLLESSRLAAWVETRQPDVAAAAARVTQA